MLDWFKIGKVPVMIVLVVGFAGFQHFFNKSTTLEKEIVKAKEIQTESMFKLRIQSFKQQQQIEKLSVQLSESKTTTKSEKEINSILTISNKKLRQSSKRKWYKLIKPDGTIIEKEYTEESKEEISNVVTSIKKEFTRKVQSIENKWLKIHKQKINQVEERHGIQLELQATHHEKELLSEKLRKTTTVNSFKYLVRAGYTTDLKYYVGAGRYMIGPIFLDSRIDFSELGFGNASIGLGISW